jgi:phosphohistidine phosphatase SixA
MKIYLMRHAEAVSPSEWPLDDLSRPLSSLGEAKLENAVAQMKKLGFTASILAVSPFVRTRQTAEIIEKYFPALEPNVCDEFASGRPLATLKAGVEKFKTQESVWIVGHMPDVAILGGRITSVAATMERSLAPGEMLALEMDISQGWGNGKILWYRTLEEWGKLKALNL